MTTHQLPDHIEAEKALPLEIEDKAQDAYLAEAIAAETQQHMGVMEAFKMYPKATFWSFAVSCVIVS